MFKNDLQETCLLDFNVFFNSFVFYYNQFIQINEVNKRKEKLLMLDEQIVLP